MTEKLKIESLQLKEKVFNFNEDFAMKLVLVFVASLFLISCEEKKEEAATSESTQEEREKADSEWERKTSDRITPTERKGF